MHTSDGMFSHVAVYMLCYLQDASPLLTVFLIADRVVCYYQVDGCGVHWPFACWILLCYSDFNILFSYFTI